jgi:acyl carrier protein
MKQKIINILTDALPLVDLDSDFLFAELSSLDITTIMMLLSEEYHIPLDAHDVTPKNFRNIDAIVAMVEKKLADIR